MRNAIRSEEDGAVAGRDSLVLRNDDLGLRILDILEQMDREKGLAKGEVVSSDPHDRRSPEEAA